MTNNHSLEEAVKKILSPGKGILAADESFATNEKRFRALGIEPTTESRRDYRGLFVTAPGMNEYISGIIFFDETIRQSTREGVPFTEILQKNGVLPGIKVDLGTEEMPGSPAEKITKGLEGLADRLKEYWDLGARFAKWRAVIAIGESLPTRENLASQADALASYALACQNAGIVPVVEPEILMDGPHTMARCEEVSRDVLTIVFEKLREKGVHIPGMILKTSMVLPGNESGETATSEEIAEATLRVFREVLPNDLRGQAFLSGGQSEIQATENLNEMVKRGPHPWTLTFSYGRALQDSALKTWAGKEENVEAAQKAFLHRAKMNSLASLGKYEGEE